MQKEIRRRKSLDARFWAKVDKSGECWTWTGSAIKSGHGRIKEGGKPMGAHRMSWEIANGKIPEGMAVLHKCDNPPCVNPAHLFLGTQLDNLKDMRAKSRSVNHGHVKDGILGAVLNMRLARAIRLDTRDPKIIIKEYQISSRQIQNIKNNKTWLESKHGC